MNRAIAILSCTLVGFLPLVATAQTQQDQSRRERGNQVINKLSGGVGQPVLEALRQDFPFLADAITDYSLGDFGRGRGWTIEPVSLPLSLPLLLREIYRN